MVAEPDPRTDPATGESCWLHPGLAPYAAEAARLGTVPSDWIGRADRLARERGMRSRAGAPIRFIAAETDAGASACAADALGYERRIFETGQVACRVTGPGARHDLHNALVWLRWPRLKAALNRGHLVPPAAADARRIATSAGVGKPASGMRSRRRDALTLIDESGLLWVSTDPDLDRMLRERAWGPLLSARRAATAAAVRPSIVGHGLLEKLHRPYRAMTAHVLIIAQAAPHASTDGARPVGPVGPSDAATDPVDAGVAAVIDRLLDADGLDPACLCPLPILGLPGWDADNIDPSYYADTRIFRPAPSGVRPIDRPAGTDPRTRR